MHKDVEPCVENTAVLEPADADYLFSAKVKFHNIFFHHKEDIKLDIKNNVIAGDVDLDARDGRNLQKMLRRNRRPRSGPRLRAPDASDKFSRRPEREKRDDGDRWTLESFS